ncbi:hypothetical protein MASR2M8_16800 [Opitutaceae bacterium]
MADSSPRIELWLARHADTAWRAALRPWVEAGRGQLKRAHVIVPTRGQAHALKLRSLAENIPLLGVEFLSPGLARKKWIALGAGGERPAMGRELLLLGLRAAIARRLVGLSPEDAAWGFWKSLQSDPERALDDFDDLLKAGFRAQDFPLPELRDVFGELTAWVESCGYGLAALAAEQAGLALVPPDAPRIGARAFVHLPGPELWGEFFNMAAYVRRCSDITVVLPEPESAAGEKWVKLWEDLLGCEPLPLDAPEPARTCEAVGALWGGEAGSAAQARVLVGRTRVDEMVLVAKEIAALLAGGAEAIGVVFPRADAAHLQLARLLTTKGIAFSDLLGTAGAPPVEVQAQRALLTFHERGARIEELLAIWPLLRAIGTTTLPVAEARRACERSFDDCQSHAVTANMGAWSDRTPELARVARSLLPAWPTELTLADAMARFRFMCGALELTPPEGWRPLEHFAERCVEPLPLAAVVAELASFLPDRQPVANAAGRGEFARVTLGTRRRLEGAAWSHLILTESNAGTWPERREASCWLTDEQRTALGERGRFSLGLPTSEERAALERASYRTLARDTREEIIFSAALFADEDPELELAPNSWLERVLWATSGGKDPQAEFVREVRSPSGRAPVSPEIAAWNQVWAGRRDDRRPFDEYFHAGDPAKITPASLSARLIERGVRDPSELWFEAVLRVRRTGWEPLVRARRKALGLRAHELLAAAVQPDAGPGRFGEMPAKDLAAAKLAAELRMLRRTWPADRYWDSFHAELTRICGELLDNLYAIEGGRYVAAEIWLPAEATLDLGARRLPITGRIDLVRLDRPGWAGAQVDIIDFKTGGDDALAAGRMAAKGASLQLGVYLAAAQSLGISGGRVWMIKPEPGAMTAIDLEGLAAALGKLSWLGEAMERGVYGALTPDRSEYAPPGLAWPLACTPVPAAILRRKFAATFKQDPGETEGGDE